MTDFGRITTLTTSNDNQGARRPAQISSRKVEYALCACFRRFQWHNLTKPVRIVLFFQGFFACLIGSVSAYADCLWSVERLANNPIIYPSMPGLEGKKGNNINGPTVMKVPTWVEAPLGKYYMYFAHHTGKYIRMAYADDPLGPWQVHEEGVLHVANTGASDHIASPDVHVDNDKKEIRMYFHGMRLKPGRGQATYLATSDDGIHFNASFLPLGWEYFRVFMHDGWFYAVAKKANRGTGVIMRSREGDTPFEEGPSIIPRMRHASALAIDNKAWLFYTRVGDKPERILATELKLEGDWRQWHEGPDLEILHPETVYEGADLPLRASMIGKSRGAENALRDPYVFVDEGNYYLYYAIRGEMGIAVSRLVPNSGCNIR